MARALVFLANGLEECEGLLVVDILRRAGVEVDTAAITDDSEVVSSHHVKIGCDILGDDADPADYDAVVLPGGLPGTTNLANSELVRYFCIDMDNAGKLVCAICAAPGALAGFGLLEGRRASIYPGMDDKLAEGGATYTGEPVTVDGNFITGEALGAAIPFALEIAAQLVGREKSDEIRAAIVYKA